MCDSGLENRLQAPYIMTFGASMRRIGCTGKDHQQINETKAMTERKEQLSRLYQGHMNTVHRDPSQLQAMDPVKRNVMAQSAMRLGDLMQENASLLKANIESINMFFKAVTNAVRDRHEEKAAA